MNVKGLIRDLSPPLLLKWWRDLRRSNNSFTGNYAIWAEAEKHARGYDSDAIFQCVREAALKVKRGEAIFERDSVCFYKEAYRWPALACLLSIAAERDGNLNVLDFGGALGSFYFQHKKFLNRLNSIRWSVIEQQHFVECGRNNFQSEELVFYSDLTEYEKNEKVDVIFLSSVLHYLEQPYATLTALSKTKAQYILVDRTPFIESEEDRLTVQNVPKLIYEASYPAWFFSQKKFDKAIENLGYRLVCSFPCIEDSGINEYKGCLYERN